jgi:predicted nucleic acid-binding protein
LGHAEKQHPKGLFDHRLGIAVYGGIEYNTAMTVPQIVLDTNVLIAAQRSRRGASSRLVSLMGTGKFGAHISVAIALEYEDVLLRYRAELGLTADDVGDLVDSLCALSKPHATYYQWRPFLRDAGDELVLELAVAAGCSHIVSFNRRNFVGAERFGIRVVTPGEFLKEIGEAV